MRGKQGGGTQATFGPQPTPPPGGAPTTREILQSHMAEPPSTPASRAATRINQARPLRGDPYTKPTPATSLAPIQIEHPDVIPASEAAKQAAVDAAVSHAIRAEEARPQPAAPAPQPAAQAPQPAAPHAVAPARRATRRKAPASAPTGERAPASSSSERTAAIALQRFLIKTGRFGSNNDRPQEVKDAQSALHVKPDGIVGKKTRAAALKQGVALPPAR
jgi:hypothetical protein